MIELRTDGNDVGDGGTVNKTTFPNSLGTLGASSATPAIRPVSGLAAKVHGVEFLFTTLLILVGLLTTWFAGYVVYRLYVEQR